MDSRIVYSYHDRFKRELGAITVYKFGKYNRDIVFSKILANSKIRTPSDPHHPDLGGSTVYDVLET